MEDGHRDVTITCQPRPSDSDELLLWRVLYNSSSQGRTLDPLAAVDDAEWLTDTTAKIRNILAPALLPFITFFIYYFCWWYFINREMRDYGRAKNTEELGTSPGTSLLAITLGALRCMAAPVAADGMGTLVVQTNPTGASVISRLME